MPKFTIKDLDLYYGDFKALNKLIWKFRKSRLLPLLALPDVENPRF